MATLGLNNSSFQSKLAESKTQAAQAGKDIQKGLSGGGDLKSGATREMLVVIRELGRGDFKRAAGSLTSLLQQMGMMSLIINPITGVIVGLGLGLFAAYKYSVSLVDKLSGLKVPDFNPEYIAKHLQKANQAAEAQKRINEEIQKTTDLYDSASKGAERFSAMLKEHFEHQRKMNDLLGQNNGLAINARERAEELKNKVREQIDLDNEAARKKKQGDSIAVNSADHDKQLLDQKKKSAEEAQKYLDELNRTPTMSENLIKAGFGGYTAAAQFGTHITGADLKKVEAQNRAEAQRRIAAFKSQVDANASNDELRKQKDELYKSAGQSASKAAELGKEIPDLAAANAQKNRDDAAEAAAKLAAESGRALPTHADVNQLQRIGAFAGSSDPKIELVRTANRSLERIDAHLQTIAQRTGGTQY